MDARKSGIFNIQVFMFDIRQKSKGRKFENLNFFCDPSFHIQLLVKTEKFRFVKVGEKIQYIQGI